ncbi:MAG: SufE family protein [Bacteroidota bacterium]|nr:SufE family protein [Bacteroidota bacterium]
MLIKEKADQIVEEFEMFDDWMDKYNYLIEMGNSLEKFDEKQKVENNLISGCQSRVWLHAEMKEGKVIFSADSDAVITKGIINLLISVLSNHTPDEIINADMNFVDQIGLKEHLSPTRSNGLLSMMKQVKLYAVAYKAKS